MAKLSDVRKAAAYRLTEPVARLLTKTPITPSVITGLGFLLTAGAAVLVIQKHLLTAGIIVLVAGFFDMLDGALARRANRVTHFGAVLDSTLDRLSEAVLLLGVLIFYAAEQSITGIVLVGAVLSSSMLVSYVRARAEALNLKCEVGVFTRTERVIVLALGLLLNQFDNALIIVLAIILAFSLFTAGQRLLYVWKHIKVR